VNINERLNFGRYSGRTINSVWTGINPFVDEDVIDIYLFELCSFLLNINDIYEIPASTFNIPVDSHEITFFQQSNTPKNVSVAKNEISIDATDGNIATALSVLLSEILTSNFQIIPHYYTENNHSRCIGHSINSIRFQLLQADPFYIIWCIENVDFFFFEPIDLENLSSEQCRYLSRFEFNRISHNTFYCDPIFKYFKFTLTEAIRSKNYDKWHRNRDRPDDSLYDISPSLTVSDVNFCAACHEFPCICSDQERSSMINDF